MLISTKKPRQPITSMSHNFNQSKNKEKGLAKVMNLPPSSSANPVFDRSHVRPRDFSRTDVQLKRNCR